MKTIVSKQILIRLLILCLLAAVVFFTALRLENRFPSTVREDMLYLPSGKFLKSAALSYDEMLADILWIRALGYFGGHAATDRDYRWLSELVDATTVLDPHFQYPYEFAGIVFATEINDIDKSISFLKAGMKNVPQAHERYWYFPFYLAFNYMYYKGDYKTAARYLEKASEFPKSPSYLPLLVSRLYANADAHETAIPFLRQMYETTDNPELKEQLKQRLNTLVSHRNIRFLEQAVKKYYQTFQNHPDRLQDLVYVGIISEIPEDPLGDGYFLSKSGDSVKSSVMPEELKVHKGDLL